MTTKATPSKKPKGSVRFSAHFVSRAGRTLNASDYSLKAWPMGEGSVTVQTSEPVMEELGFDPSDELIATVEDGSLVIRRARQADREELHRRVNGLMDAHDKTLRKLAE